jgi:tight adherence protein B
MPSKGFRKGAAGRLRWLYLAPSALLISLIAAVAWAERAWLHQAFLARPAIFPALGAACVVLFISLAGILWAEQAGLRLEWTRRARRVSGLARLQLPPIWLRWARRMPDLGERALGPFLRTGLGRRLAADWIDAGLGKKASRYVALLALAGAAVWVPVQRLAGSIVSAALAASAVYILTRLVHGRAEAGRRRLGEQLPQALDAMAAGLAAGLSFEQAVGYAEQELPQPVSGLLRKLSRRMALGQPTDEALNSLVEEEEDAALALVVEGITLIRRFGGDLIRMLEETGELLRQRVELEREVLAATSQGRLSGAVIAALVPVSAGILFSFNPQYVNVLFDTIAGQLLLVLALALQLAGWAIISRLVRIRT